MNLSIIYLRIFLLILVGMCFEFQGIGQIDTISNEYLPSIATSQVNKKRRNLALSLGGTTYTLGSIALYETWYKNFPRSSFHFYDDSREWRGMDKAGHVFSTYSQANLCFQGWQWTGQNEKNAIWSGLGCALMFQSTIEVMDGLSTQWGFSWSDMGANLVGAGLFAGQQLKWGEQRIVIKNSSSLPDYSQYEGVNPTLINDRITNLYGQGFAQRWLKDYNGQTIWLSANIKSFWPKANLPEWLNFSIGYSAENMFGGFTNSWSSDGLNFSIDENLYPRYSQFYISLDADLSRIQTDSPFVRTLLDILNVIKVPFSAIEVNTLGEVKMHLIRF